MEKEIAIVITDGSMESATLCGAVRGRYDCVLLDISGAGGDGDPIRQAIQMQVDYLRPRASVEASVPGSAIGMETWTIALGHAAQVAREHDAATILMPIRIGQTQPDAQVAEEWLQMAEELLRFGLSLGKIRLEAPLVSMEPWQMVEVAQQTAAPLHTLHGQKQHAAFVQAGAAKP